MQAGHNPTEKSCPGCDGCRADDSAAEDGSLTPPMTGRQFVIASIWFFLGPLALALVGAVCFRQSHEWQFLGSIAGLGIGMAAAAVISRAYGRQL